LAPILSGTPSRADPPAVPLPVREALREIPLYVDVVDAETDVVLTASPRVVHGRLQAGQMADVTLGFDTPAGYVDWERRQLREQISRLATSAVARFPLHTSFDLTVRVLGSDGTPARAPQCEGVALHAGSRRGEERQVRYDEESPGVLLVRGLPRLPGAAMVVRCGGFVRGARGKEVFEYGSASFDLPTAAGARVDVRLMLGSGGEPAPAALGWQPELEWEPGAAKHSMVRGRMRAAPRLAPGVPAPNAASGVLRLTVLTSDWARAQRVWVEVGVPGAAWRQYETDSRGVLRISGLPTGPVTARLVEPGLVPTHETAIVRPDTTSEVLLAESPGGALRVSVKTEDGRAAAYARLDVRQPSGEPWLDVEGGVQRIDPFVDAGGRRDLRRLEPGRVRVRATWGLLSATADVPVSEGRSRDVLLVVKPP
jgi:hypothetical protein